MRIRTPGPAAMSLLGVLLAWAAAGVPESRAGDFRVSCPVFADRGDIPPRYTCDGADASPPLSIENVPPGARSLALIVDDPDAPRGTWVHWVVWGIDPKAREIREGVLPEGAVQGTNDFGKRRYGGPCPPSGRHRYYFKLYALDKAVDPGAGATKARLEAAMKGHIVGKAELVGLYRRAGKAGAR
ncbi:MAG: YbhB/YbcL family Raf kinase inhibitor-like protein [Gemmatimonadota bacterium]